MNSRNQLITSLVDDLSVKKYRIPVMVMALIWWFLSWVYVVIATSLLGEIRVIHDHETVLHSHQFLLESLIGLVASLLIAVVAWYGSIPAALTKRLVFIAFAFVATWLSFYVVGFFEPALTPSMQGKREYCYLEAFIYSMPPIMVACYYLLRRYPINTAQTGFFIGLAGGIMPALFMQFSCMYEPAHIFTHHIIPAGIVSMIGAIVLYAGGKWQANKKVKSN